jgi:hypothetical protein
MSLALMSRVMALTPTPGKWRLPLRQRTLTGFLGQQPFLFFGRVNEGILHFGAGGGSPMQGRPVSVATPLHLGHKLFVTFEESLCLANPALGFGMHRIPAHAIVESKYVPESVKFPVLTEQMLSTELLGWHIPDPHLSILPVLLDDHRGRGIRR